MTVSAPAKPEPQKRRSRPALLILGVGLLALLIAAAPRWQAFAATTADWLDHPFMRVGSSEGLIQHETVLMQQGGLLAIYSPVTPERFTSAPYPPLYYWANALVSPKPADLAARAKRIVAGVQAKRFDPPTDSPFGGGRRISLVATFAAALCIGLLVYFGTPGGRMTALVGGGIGAGLWLTLPAVSIWASRVRADMLMTALQLAALVVVARWPHKWPVLALAAAPLFALALLTKQTALAGPLAALVWLLWRGLAARQGWRPFAPALALGGGLALWLGVPFAVLDVASGNQLWLRLVVYHVLPWQGRNFGTYFDLFWRENLGLLLVGLPAAIFVCIRAPRIVTAPPLPALTLLAALPLLYGLGVAGADHNHFLPIEAAACVGTGWAVAWLAGAARRLAWGALAVALGVLVAQAALFSVPQASYAAELTLPTKAVQRQYTQILANAATQPGPILSSEAGWSVLAGKDTAYNDLFTLNALADKGIYDRTGLFTSIRTGAYGVILSEGNLAGRTRPDVWSPDLVQVVLDRYTPLYRDAWYTYVPKP